MEYYLDSANIEAIKEYVEGYNLAGVTCNPSIVAKDKVDLKELVAAVPEGKRLFIQCISDEVDEIIEEVQKIMALSDTLDIVVKVPATRNGLKAIAKLSKMGIKVLATAIYSASQALMAANCGAAYVAPYVNRICNLERDGVAVTLQIADVFHAQNIPCKVVAASFKNVDQVNTLLVNNVDAVTVPVDLMERLVHNTNADDACKQFVDDWEGLTGKRELGL